MDNLHNPLSLSDTIKPEIFPDREKFVKLREKYSPRRRPTSRQLITNNDDISKPASRSTSNNKSYEIFATSPQRIGSGKPLLNLHQFADSREKINLSAASPVKLSESTVSGRQLTLKDSNTIRLRHPDSKLQINSPVKIKSSQVYQSPVVLGKSHDSKMSPEKDDGHININLMEKLNDTKSTKKLFSSNDTTLSSKRKSDGPQRSDSRSPKIQRITTDPNSVIKLKTSSLEDGEIKHEEKNDSFSPKKKVTFNTAVEYNDTFTTTDLKNEEIPSLEDNSFFHNNEEFGSYRTEPPNFATSWNTGNEKSFTNNMDSTIGIPVLLSPIRSDNDARKLQMKENGSSEPPIEVEDYFERLLADNYKISQRLDLLDNVDSKFGSLVDVLVKFENKVNKNQKKINSSINQLYSKFNSLDEKLNMIFGRQTEILSRLAEIEPKNKATVSEEKPDL